MRGLGSIPTWEGGGNISHWIFFVSRSKTSDANIGIIANFVWYVKNPIVLTSTAKRLTLVFWFFSIEPEDKYFLET